MARFQFFAGDRRQTTDDKTNCLTPLRACAHGVITMTQGEYTCTPATDSCILCDRGVAERSLHVHVGPWYVQLPYLALFPGYLLRAWQP